MKLERITKLTIDQLYTVDLTMLCADCTPLYIGTRNEFRCVFAGIFQGGDAFVSSPGKGMVGEGRHEGMVCGERTVCGGYIIVVPACLASLFVFGCSRN